METRINPLILEEAAGWFVEFDGEEADLAQRKAFDEWLRRSPEHVRAFLELLPIWERGAMSVSEQSADPEELIALALKSRANVVELSIRASGRTSSAPSAFTPTRRAVLSVGLAACIALAAFGIWRYSERNTYTTDVGEQRSITLADGSVIELNARSQVRVRLGNSERDIDLIDGQALFRVARDKSRPFVVHSGDTGIRAVGTQFDVYRKRLGTTVTVLEGRVAVSPQYRPPQTNYPIEQTAGGAGVREAVLLSAGEQLEVAPTVVPVPKRANLAAATAWTQRQLMFQKTSLADVADEFNRYNTRPLRIEDPGIRAFLVSGTFSSTDPASLLRFLRERQGIRVNETDNEILIEPSP